MCLFSFQSLAIELKCLFKVYFLCIFSYALCIFPLEFAIFLLAIELKFFLFLQDDACEWPESVYFLSKVCLEFILYVYLLMFCVFSIWSLIFFLVAIELRFCIFLQDEACEFLLKFLFRFIMYGVYFLCKVLY